MEYTQLTLSDWMEMKNKLRQELQGVKQSFVRIGYVLRRIDDGKLYEQDGYKSVAEFAKAEYGLEASTVSRFMSINREYSIDGYSERLREEYLDLSRSQLEEMLKLPEPDRKMITPETPREDIRDLKRFNREEPTTGVADDLNGLIEEFFREHPEELNQIFAGDHPEGTKWLTELVNPGGSRSFRKGMYFLMMSENHIAVKKFGFEPKNLSWTEFLEITKEIFGPAAGTDTWKNYFGGTDEEKTEENRPADQPVTDDSTAGFQSEAMDPATEAADKESTDSTVDPDPEKPAERQDVPEPEKEIAPAQKSEKKPEQKLEKPEQKPEKPEQEERQKDTTEAGEPAEKAKGQQEIVDKPFGSRKMYIDSLTEYGAAEYLTRSWRMDTEFVEAIKSAEAMYTWMMQEVDDKGRRMEE